MNKPTFVDQVYPDLCEQEQINRGELIAEVLQVKLAAKTYREPKMYQTTWGNKTPMGLFLTVERLVRDGK